MEVKESSIIIGSAVITSLLALVLICRGIELLWLKPKKIESRLRKQGINGNSYKPLMGDIKELIKLTNQSWLEPIDLAHDHLPRLLPFILHTIHTHGKICFAWIGPVPWLIISDPEKAKEVLTNYRDFQKPDNTTEKLLAVGLFGKEGDTGAKHRRIINPAFHIDRLKNVCSTMYESCSAMIKSLEKTQAFEDDDDALSIEVDVWPFLKNLSGDFISRVAFGTSYEQGKRIFDLQTDYVKLALLRLQPTHYIPGWRYLPTKKNKRVKEIIKQVKETLTEMIETRKAEMAKGGSTKNDLLGILMESNMRENRLGLTTKEVAEECQLFYLAGSETTSSLLVWTLILLSKYPIWQDRARAEVLHEFGKDGHPNIDGLNRLKIVSMILHEVLRLYPPAYMLMRKVYKDIQLKGLLIPAETEIILPLCVIHQDSDLWGEDSKEFNPERFGEGVVKATKGKPIYFPFSVGPRNCIGKSLALLEVKLVLTMILQRYSLRLSPN